MIKQLQSTRVCSVCGQRKPLVSFVELIGGGKGHTYSTICITCRRSGMDQDDAGHFGSDTRLQLDIKTKVRLEQDKKAHTKEIKLEQLEKVKKDRTEAKETKDEKKREDIDKKYRDKYLKSKNESKSSPTEKPATSKENKAAQTKGFYQEKSRVNTEFQKQVTGQQLGKKTQGITGDYINKYVAATGRSPHELFGNLLGQLMRNKLNAQNNPNAKSGQQAAKAAEKKVNPQTTFANKEKAPAAKAETKENAATAFLRKNFTKR